MDVHLEVTTTSFTILLCSWAVGKSDNTVHPKHFVRCFMESLVPDI